MKAEDRATARRQLDKKLDPLRRTDILARPSRGWIRAIRESLGMTTAQLARRIGVSQPRAVAIEKAEISGAITLDSLERVAQAMDCQLVYTLVPRKPLDELVEERARHLATQQLETTRHSMALEAQGVDKIDEEEHIKRLIRRLVEKNSTKLWGEKND